MLDDVIFMRNLTSHSRGHVRACVHDGDGRTLDVLENDGPGFDPTVLREGHGLELLRARLSMLFGDAASLRVTSAPGATRATLNVPVTIGA